MDRRHFISGAVSSGTLAMLAPTAIGQSVRTPTAQVRERIANVEASLAPAIHVAGEPRRGPWSLLERMALYQVPGVSIAVIQDKQIDWAKGYGVLDGNFTAPVTPETLFQAASISKSVTAVAALRLVEQGKLVLDDPVNASLKSWKVPENEFTGGAPVTLRQLLSHSAGITANNSGIYSPSQPMPTIVQLLNGTPPSGGRPVRVESKPGETWRYSNNGYAIVQTLLEDVTGKKPFPELMNELVLAPAGMTRSRFEQPLALAARSEAAAAHSRAAETLAEHSFALPDMAAGGLWSTPTDLVRLALAVAASFNEESGSLLSSQMAREMLTPQIADWGLGVTLATKAEGVVFSHTGKLPGYRAVWYASADGRSGACVMTNGENGGLLWAEILAAIGNTYGWSFGATDERVALELTEDQAAKFAGAYRASGVIATVSAQANRLWIESQPALFPRTRLYVASPTRTFLGVGDWVTMTTDADGRPQTLEISPGVIATKEKPN